MASVKLLISVLAKTWLPDAGAAPALLSPGAMKRGQNQ
jgi:hypothetical protein